MARYTVVRLAEGLVVLLLISVATFLIIRGRTCRDTCANAYVYGMEE